MGKYGTDDQIKFFYKGKFLGSCDPDYIECPALLELMKSDRGVATSILNYMNSLGDPVFPISEEDWSTPETNIDNIDVDDLYATFMQELDYDYSDFPDDFYVGGDYLLPDFEIFVGSVAEDNVVSSTRIEASAPNSPDVDKTKLVRQVIKQAKKIRDYFQNHNNNLNRKQEQYLEDLSDGIDNESVAAIRGAIENLKYNSKNLRSEQYNLIMDLYDAFNLAGGKFEGMGYPEDDIDACDKVTASTSASSIVNKIYSVMMNYEYGYDPDMTDINSMLQELTNRGVHVDNSTAFKKAWVSAHNKAERKTWGSSGDSYHYDSLTPRELEAIENYDTEYWEYVKDHPFNLKPASITSSTDTKYFANMVSASDDGADESEWYDWWNDVDCYLMGWDKEFKQLIYDFRKKNGWPKDFHDPLCDKLADVIYEYVRTHLDKLDIDPSENDDRDYREFAGERMLDWLLDRNEPAAYDFWADYKG